MPSAEEMKKQTSDKPDSDSTFDDGSTEEESQNDTSSIGTQEEIESSGSGRNFSLKPAYLSSNPQSQQQSLFSLITDHWFKRQKIRYSPQSNFCSIVTVSSMTRLPLHICCFCALALRFFFLPPLLNSLVSCLRERLVSVWLMTNKRYFFVFPVWNDYCCRQDKDTGKPS